MVSNKVQQNIILIKDYLSYLSLLAIEKAQSGHPGLPLGCSKIGSIIYKYFLRFNPQDPTWLGRDRFVLSAGHGSMLLYALNYFFGFNLSLKDISLFRQFKSNTPGHPEYNLKKGIETTTGPLGQGFANAVGIALEGKMLQARFPKEASLFDYQTYTLMGDGCMMEGVTYEAASLAGNFKLDNLLAIYDKNKISIDGNTELTFNENVAGRFIALGWDTITLATTDINKIISTLEKLQKKKDKPKLLILKTTIGNGLKKLAGTAKIHGSPAGLEEITYFIKNSSLSSFFPKNEESFKKVILEQIKKGNFLPKEKIIEKITDTTFLENKKNLNYYKNWNKKYQSSLKKNKTFIQLKQGLSSSLKDKLLNFKIAKKPAASRDISHEVLQICSDSLKSLVGGSADLVASTKATIKNSNYINTKDFSQRNIPYGIREHGMASINNGLALNDLFIPFSSTFLSFLDYLKPALRLAAISKLKHLFIFSHDSIQVGEDGPTHQPIEHINSLRLIPGHHTFRPANDKEMAMSFIYFLENSGPVSIITSRQSFSTECFLKEHRLKDYASFKKGAYPISKTTGKIDIILMGTGGEVGPLLECKKILDTQKINAKVVSVPCLELFEKSTPVWKKSIFENNQAPVYFLEASSFRGFTPLLKENLHLKSMNEFGASAPKETLLKNGGWDNQSIVKSIKAILKK